MAASSVSSPSPSPSTSKSSSSKRKPVPSPEMNKRMQKLLTDTGNQTCADCPAHRPRWVSFLMSPSHKGERIMGVFTCANCAQYHWYELGKKRCMIKYLKMAHEWSMEDIRILESSGNVFVNNMFEANLSEEDFDKALVLKDEDKESARRSKFIKNKYKRHRYCDDILFHEMMINLLKRKKRKQEKATKAKKKEEEEPAWWESPGAKPTESSEQEKASDSKKLLSSEKETMPKPVAADNEEPEATAAAAPRRYKITKRQFIRNLATMVEAGRASARGEEESNHTKDSDIISVSMRDESLQLDALQSSMHSASSSGRMGDEPHQRARRFNSRNLQACLEGSDSTINNSSRTDASLGSSKGSQHGPKPRPQMRKRQSFKVGAGSTGRLRSLSGSNLIDKAAIVQMVNEQQPPTTPPQGGRRRRESLRIMGDDKPAAKEAKQGQTAAVASSSSPSGRSGSGGMGRHRSMSNPNLLLAAAKHQQTAAVVPTSRRDVMRRRRSFSNPTLSDVPALKPAATAEEGVVLDKTPVYLQAIAQVSNRQLVASGEQPPTKLNEEVGGDSSRTPSDHSRTRRRASLSVAEKTPVYLQAIAQVSNRQLVASEEQPPTTAEEGGDRSRKPSDHGRSRRRASLSVVCQPHNSSQRGMEMQKQFLSNLMVPESGSGSSGGAKLLMRRQQQGRGSVQTSSTAEAARAEAAAISTSRPDQMRRRRSISNFQVSLDNNSAPAIQAANDDGSLRKQSDQRGSRHGGTISAYPKSVRDSPSMGLSRSFDSAGDTAAAGIVVKSPTTAASRDVMVKKPKRFGSRNGGNKFSGRNSVPNPESGTDTIVPGAAQLGYEDADAAAAAAEQRKLLRKRKEKLSKVTTPPKRGNSSESLKLGREEVKSVESLEEVPENKQQSLSRSSSSSSLTTDISRSSSSSSHPAAA